MDPKRAQEDSSEEESSENTSQDTSEKANQVGCKANEEIRELDIDLSKEDAFSRVRLVDVKHHIDMTSTLINLIVALLSLLAYFSK